MEIVRLVQQGYMEAVVYHRGLDWLVVYRKVLIDYPIAFQAAPFGGVNFYWFLVESCISVVNCKCC